MASQVFSLGRRVRLMSKLSVTILLICVSKQKVLFSSIIFYLQSAEGFFHGLHDSLCNTIAGYLSVALLHNILWYSM